MKKLLALLLCFSCLFSFAACGADKGDTFGAEGTAEDWGIHMTLENVSSTGLTLTITRSGGIAAGSLETGADYYLERSEDGVFWEPVSTFEEPVWDMMSRLILEGENLVFNLDWSWLYGNLEPGQYRIYKTITLFGETGAKESQIYCEGFEIK